ncbi:endonuclease III [Legionella sp. PC997]|uniref:endonuclease III n=1 Tax=Legionella sp. PC997 TaxID=2755562 RepID=UPI0015FA2033|nr:endonuclease III [Legionella sp. PC997]QMT58779.1 endonuclease III [Legionella sp. PC997]
MNKQQRHEIFARFQEQNPHPTTELTYRSSFELLIAVILSAQATDVGVNKATAKLFPVANTPQGILDLGLDRLKEYIKSIGLYNSKAQNIMNTCDLLVKKYKGNVPNQREELQSLPGVGRKTANVILNTAFGEPTVAVDTHIFRVANRTGLAKGKTPLAVEKALLKNIEPKFLKDAHHWLILHGRYVCTALRPHCKNCIIQDLCEYPDKNWS